MKISSRNVWNIDLSKELPKCHLHVLHFSLNLDLCGFDENQPFRLHSWFVSCACGQKISFILVSHTYRGCKGCWTYFQRAWTRLQSVQSMSFRNLHSVGRFDEAVGAQHDSRRGPNDEMSNAMKNQNLRISEMFFFVAALNFFSLTDLGLKN